MDFGQSYTEPASVLMNAIRSVFAFFDRPAYWLLTMAYMLFFNVASADIFNNETIMRFYGRVQVILGVFMMFQLSMTILKGIVNPDSFTGDKGSGRTIITKVITSLLLLTILMPIPIPNPSSEYEKRINNNGLLFGTLYSLQNRILSNNTIGRLVLGTSSTNTTFMSGNDEDNSLDQATRIFTSTIIKSFYRINLVPEDQRDTSYITKGEDPAIYNNNRVCTDIDDAILETYTAIDANPFDIISMVNATCDSDAQPGFLNNIHTTFQTLTGSTKYVFSYMGIVSFIVPLVFAIILFSFTIDIAVRAVKLAVLRLLAPIPIIRYMDPNGGKDSAFNAWVKALTSTYLDLFIRLATVYFVIFIIQDMIINGISINDSYGRLLNVFTYIAIWIGLFVFAKQAPKFIKQILGMKEDSGKFFDGISTALGLGAAAGGAIGSGISSARASKLADQTRESYGEKTIFGNDVKADSFLNKGKHLLAGLAGGVSGAYTGGKAALTAKDHAFKNSLDAMQKRNADVIAKGNDGSTLLGRMGSSARSFFTGEGSSAAVDRDIKSLESQQKALDAIKSRVSGEMVKQDWTYGTGGKGFTSTSGASLDDVRFNHKSFSAAMAAAQAEGKKTITVNGVDASGAVHSYEIDFDRADMMKGTILKNNEDDYIQKARSASFTSVDGRTMTDKFDQELYDLIEDARRKGAAGKEFNSITDKNGNVIYTRTVSDDITTRDDYTKVSEEMGRRIRSKTRENTINKANDRFSGKK